MYKVPFKIDLKGKTAVVTGGGGVLCSTFAKALAACGANVAILNRTKEKADIVAAEIAADGGKAISIAANVLEKDTLIAAKKEINDVFGSCDILLNGAGGNNPKGITKEYNEEGDINREDITSFFDLDPAGMVNLNFLGTLLPTQIFAPDMLNKKDGKRPCILKEYTAFILKSFLHYAIMEIYS